MTLVKPIEFYLFCDKCRLNYLSTTYQLIYHTWVYTILKRLKVFEVVFLHLHTVMALYHSDGNENFHAS